MKTFHRLLVNALISTVMTSFLWFALTFWVYLETRSVLATSVIGGAFAIFSSVFGILFGTFVDHHRKWTAMMVAAVDHARHVRHRARPVRASCRTSRLLSFSSANFWVLVALVLAGSVVGNMRAIAMSTTVTLLVPEEHRDRANGLVGTVMGVSFAITSVLSGLVVGRLGMGWALVIAVALTAVSVVHLLTIRFDEPEPERSADGERPPAFDIKGSLAAISGVAGLYGLIFFAAFNNLLGGVFMSLMDAYGLSLMSVEAWGVLFGIVSFGMIGGGLYVSKKGLGSTADAGHPDLQPRQLVGLHRVHPAVEHPAAVHRHARVDVADAGDRSGGADRPPAGRAVRTAGAGVRVRPDRRDGGIAGHGSPDRAVRPVRGHAVHDRRCRCRSDRQLVRHR